MNEALLIQRKKILYTCNNSLNSEWWWSLDTSLDIIHDSLNNNRYCIIDDFLLDNECDNVYDEVQAAYQQGLLNSRGSIAGGRKGDDNLKVEDESIRNDTLGYFDGNEDEWPSGSNQGGLTRALDKINTIVYELRDHKKKKNDDSNELKNVRTRSRAMITCYAGNGSKYTKHCDNPIRNGRKLTVILYLNKNWNTDTDGGCLRLYEPYNTSNHNHYIDIKPTFNSLLLFWSDFRCPHEVLPCYRHRFAITCWFIDSIEKKEADDNEKIEKDKNTDSNCDVKNTNTTDVFELD